MQYEDNYTAPTMDPLQAFTASLTPKRAVSYLRVSTREQAERGGEREGFSIPAQREANKRKAASLGAMVIKEFVDRGASARSANRPELQRMLEYIESNPVDFVIVHKLDRLARNRADDVEISQALTASKVRLVSTTESIDETPSGMLLHGIMSSIAEFYSRNLAHEVTKGMSQKARGGGTVGRAPLGYRNVRIIGADGREAATVVLDEDRAHLIRLAFDYYATGEWSLKSLTEHLCLLGLTTLATPRIPSKPIRLTQLHKVLINPYYKGVVTYQDVQYVGRHERLVDDATWQRVQDVMTTHLQGERTREHPHYLKSTVYCGSCGERLIVNMTKSHSGTVYPYFLCSGRQGKRNNCQQKAVLIYQLEQRVEDLYDRISMDGTFRNSVSDLLKDELRSARADAKHQGAALKREVDKLERQREKLLQAHYAGAIPLDLLKSEQDRIGTSLFTLNMQLAESQSHTAALERNLEIALEMTVDCAMAYRAAPPQIRKQFNQVFFERILVNPDLTLNSQMSEPFAGLLSPAAKALPAPIDDRNTTQKTPQEGGLTCGKVDNPDPETTGVDASNNVNCFDKTTMVELRGFEPLASSMRTKRATNCATAPCGGRA